MVRRHEIKIDEDTSLLVTVFSDGGMSFRSSALNTLHLHPEEVQLLLKLMMEEFPLDALGQI